MSADGSRTDGHTVLAIPVPALEPFVRERTAFYDPSFVSADPTFVHAHLTVLAPWIAEPTASDLGVVERIARETASFSVRLARIGEFPDGVLHLVPEPDDGLRALTARLVEAFPAYPPYGGAYDDVVPHVTLDRRGPEVTPETVHAAIADLLPVDLAVERIDLQWWANDDCRVLASFPLGAA
ncbi:2'-5' RNA ligase family protein [Nocardioides fonticola]|uniref:2'-5' RNA ligase family protein n=1 Tax=Nocardioides fonticola TaxID=450363 RepID=A0ABP7XW96_9ACTN